MSDRVDAQMLADWRINYNLVGRTPAEAMRWWHDHMDGKAPAGAVASLGLCINEIERLTAALQWEQSRAERLGTHGPGCADWGPSHYECAIRERDELRRQLAEAELDARRYRWLAGHCRSTSEHWGGRWSIIVDGPAPKSHDSEDAFDAAIDAARSKEHK